MRGVGGARAQHIRTDRKLFEVKLLSDNPTLLWLSDRPVPPNVFRAAGGKWRVESGRCEQWLAEAGREATLAVVQPEGACEDPALLMELVAKLEESNSVAVFMLPADAGAAHDLLTSMGGALLCVREDADSEELAAKFSAAKALQPAILRLRKEADGDGSGAGGKEISRELRLAARLQQDFLPRRLPEVGAVRFGALFRPASWVSGDIYDIMRLDETHVGFYVIDSVGHGVPAALMTMFIRRALQTKRINGSEYHIVPPDQTLAELNADICSEDLSGGQFCTGVYCVLDSESMELTYSRAGHPEPVIIRGDGSTELLEGDGPLVGVFPDCVYESRGVRLGAGDRVFLYTDGAEEALKRPGEDFGHGRTFPCIVQQYAGMPREQMLLEMSASLDIKYGLGHPEDDITIVMMEVER